MKNKIIILFLLMIYFNACRTPSEPMGEIKILNRLETIDTGGECLDVAVDIQDSTIVVAANYNGYFIYEFVSKNGVIQGIDQNQTIHISPDNMFASQGDNRAQTVDISTKHDIAFVMDQYDHIWLYKYGEGALQYTDNFLDESNCYSGTWIDVAIDDNIEKIGVYSLIKHNAAETTDDCNSLQTQNSCENQMDLLFCNWINDNCISNQSVEYLEYSTSLVWSNLESIGLDNISLDGDSPACEYIINQGAIADKIFFNNSLLLLAYGELGIRAFEQADQDICLVGSEVIDFQNENYSNYNDFCMQNYLLSSEVDYRSCCEVSSCPTGIGQCPWFNQEGLGGIFSSSGGIIPKIYVEFDLPGEVESIFSLKQNNNENKHIIFSGLSNSNGCVMTVLNDTSIENSIDFAKGYTIKDSYANEQGLLALAAGHDGILLYNWNISGVSFLGKINTPYANSVKIAGKTIFVATEDGLEIIQIQ